MTEPTLTDPFDRWWAEHRRRPAAADPVDGRPAAHGPLITEAESQALHLGARALAEVAEGLMRSGRPELAAESARSADALDRLQQRATVAAGRDQVAEPEAER